MAEAVCTPCKAEGVTESAHRLVPVRGRGNVPACARHYREWEENGRIAPVEWFTPPRPTQQELERQGQMRLDGAKRERPNEKEKAMPVKTCSKCGDPLHHKTVGSVCPRCRAKTANGVLGGRAPSRVRRAERMAA